MNMFCIDLDGHKITKAEFKKYFDSPKMAENYWENLKQKLIRNGHYEKGAYFYIDKTFLNRTMPIIVGQHLYNLCK